MVKEKPGSTRIYDADGFRRRAACICVKSESENEVSCWCTKFQLLSCRNYQLDPHINEFKNFSISPAFNNLSQIIVTYCLIVRSSLTHHRDRYFRINKMVTILFSLCTFVLNIGK